MDEFLELEKKCKKLKIKKLLKYLILIILIISLIIGLYLFIQSKAHKSYIQENKTIIKITKIKPVKKETNKTLKIKIIESKKIKEKNKTIIKKVIKPIKIPEWNVQFNLNEINITKEIKIKSKVKKEINKTIVKENPNQMFKSETITVDKALKLAKFYYNNDDYQTSMKWCKIASNIDNSNEKIWKLYALNLEKLNQKQKAIKVLKTYLKYKDSSELEFILQRLEK